MDCYPAGLAPSGYPQDGPTMVAEMNYKLPSQGPIMPPPAPEAAALPDNDMELLEQILRECHLSDSAGRSAAAQPAAMAGASASCSSAGQVQGEVNTAAVTLEQWADEMVRVLQCCSSVEEARPKCMEMLAMFQQTMAQANPDYQRLRTLQGANSALLRGFRNMYHRQREMTARQQQAEEENRRMAEELARCKEALQASERAKNALQYHLQLMGTNSSP